MKKIIIFMALAAIAIGGPAYAVGSFPIPQITDVSFTVQTSYDPVTDRFTYDYSITSGATNIGEIGVIAIDIEKGTRRYEIPPADFHFSTPKGTVSAIERMEDFETVSKLPFGTTIETVSTDFPDGWIGSPAADGNLMIIPPGGGLLDANGELTNADLIEPGETITGLTVTGLAPPTLREVMIFPDWMAVAADEAADTDEFRAQSAQVWQDIVIRKTTLGPSYANYGTGLIDRVIVDVDKMVVLGWMPDDVLATNIQTLLVEAYTLKYAADGTQAKVKLQQILDLLETVTEAQMRQEAIDLIQINTQLIFDHTSDTYIPQDLMLLVDPKDSVKEIGQQIIFTPTLVDQNRNNEPVQDWNWYTLNILSGPHAGIGVEIVHEGDQSVGYKGHLVGTDIVEIIRDQNVGMASTDSLAGFELAALDDPDSSMSVQARVTWTGGPDLVISYFSPPFLKYAGADVIYIHEGTKNIGTTDATIPTTTRYYMSATPDFDIATAHQLAERTVEPLTVDGHSESGSIAITWPVQFSEGTYYFAACTDANNVVAELNENNNCSYHQVDKVASIVSMMTKDPVDVSVNTPPFCDDAVPSRNRLSPNGSWKKVQIEGITDVDNDGILIEITGITQDEPVDSLTGGVTSPDGRGVGTPFARLRSEQDDPGDGRVYQVHFTATDTAGNQCSGMVQTEVIWHNSDNVCIPSFDSGQVFDSSIDFN